MYDGMHHWITSGGRGAVYDETAWRNPLPFCASAPTGSQLLVSRWRTDAAGKAPVTHSGHPDHHTISVNLTRSHFEFILEGDGLFDGHAMPGATQVTAPGTPVQAYFHSPVDILHLYVPDAMVTAICDEDDRSQPSGRTRAPDPAFLSMPPLNG